MKKIPKPVLIVFGLIVGFFCFAYILNSVERAKDRENYKLWQSSGAQSGGIVLVADRNIESNSLVHPDDLHEIKIEENRVPYNSVLCKRIVLGKKIKKSIVAGEILKIDHFGSDSVTAKEQNTLLSERESKEAPVCNHRVKPGSLPVTVPVVYALENIPEGNLLEPDKLKEKRIDAKSRPEDAIFNISCLDDVKTKYGMSQGQLATARNLDPEIKAKVIKASKPIEAGKIISSDDTYIGELSFSSCPITAIDSSDSVVGKKASRQIDKDEIFKANCIE